MADNLFFSRDTKVFMGLSTIRQLHIQTAGTGYTTVPAIAITGGGATTQATATCTVNNGGVNSVTVTGPGVGYTSNPTVTVGNIYANSTALAVGVQVNAGGILYTVTSAGTTASSGNGPTHTSGSADDGTVTFAHAGVASVIRGGAGIWEIPIIDGFSMSQGTNTTEVTLNEMADSSGNSRRGRQLFTDSYAPAEWSFSTYMRPLIASGTVANGGIDNVTRHHAVEEVLWAQMVGDGSYIAPVEGTYNTVWKDGIYNTLTTPYNDQQVVKFEESNKVTLGTFDLYFNLGETTTVEKTTKLITFSNASQIAVGEAYDAGAYQILHLQAGVSAATLKTNWQAVGWVAGNGQGANNGSNPEAGDLLTVGSNVGTDPGFPDNTGSMAPTSGVSNPRMFINGDTTGVQLGDLVKFFAADGTTALFSGATQRVTGINDLGGNVLVKEITLDLGRNVPIGSVLKFEKRINYKVENCVVNEASIDFDLDGIATINWSGLGSKISEFGNVTPTVTEGTSSTSNFIRNRLTSLAIKAADEATFPGHDGEGRYSTVLTGGNITFSNNITYLTPETMGLVNQPLGHVTGTRSIGGSFTCYLDNDGNATAGTSADLFEDIHEARTTITNVFELTFGIGGSGNTPRCNVELRQCHLELPTHSLDDVVSLEVNFHALPSSISDADEAIIAYKGA